jgi:multidrug transporter EmrE-like cation transporter
MIFENFGILLYALLAIFGAMARQLQEHSKGSFRAVVFLSGAVIAGFTGSIIYFIAAAMNLDTNVAYALAGISGWIGPQA